MFSIIQAAGWPIWFLIFSSIAAIAIIVERFINLQQKKIMPPSLLEEAMTVSANKVPSSDIIQKLAASSLMGGVLASGLRAVQQTPNATETDVRNAMESSGHLAIHILERFLPALSTIASTAPLLGLFGTVIGMIEIFGAEQVAGQNDPTAVAHGISVALYNTAFGLLVAIIAYLFHHYFRSRVEDYILILEQNSERFARHLIRFVERKK
ncbi:MAG: MotA/TolQ/ExbB proton channel family protein [Saezia sp.]